MKLAIHHDARRYTERWIQYCRENNVEYKIVDCYASDIIQQMDECDALMWNWNQNNYRNALMAKQLTISLETGGKKVFPDYNTCWHFDDKAGQKYLLESIDAPVVKTDIFYSKKDAEQWLDTATFPKVFKLRGGAGSINVELIRTRAMARSYINRAFGKGFSLNNRWGRLMDTLWVLRRDKNFKAIKGVFKGMGRLFIRTELAKFSQREKGYIYFQDFAPGNPFDTRLFVVGNKCVGIRRYVRENDFRASGSGVKAYDPELFDKGSIKLAFEIAQKLKLQSAAFDFIWHNDKPKIVEVSYTSHIGAFYNDCPGYWDPNLEWHPATINLEYFMIEDFIESLK